VSGMFPQLRLDTQAVFGAAGAKLLGTYELELVPALNEIGAQSPAIVIDVGGADGYYAVGFARFWQCRVIVFERLAQARAIIARNGALNQSGMAIELRGECDEPALHAVVRQQPRSGLLIMDVEGAELDLISERVAQSLTGWQIVIETHDFARPGCLAELERRLAPTHDLQRIVSRPREVADFPLSMPLSMALPAARKLKLMDEQRPGAMTWLVGRPRGERRQ
jgi:hypothetical protein